MNGGPYIHARQVRTYALVNKVIAQVTEGNPPTQSKLANKYNCSARTISRIIKEEANLQTRMKMKVHKLEPRHESIRIATAKRFLGGLLKQKNLESCVTLDEAWLYLDDFSQFCYFEKVEKVNSDWIKINGERYGCWYSHWSRNLSIN